MDKGRRTYVTAAVIVLLALLIPSVAYFCAYVFAAKTHVDQTGIVRIYKSRWQSEFFQPAGRAESLLTGKDVVVVYPEP